MSGRSVLVLGFDGGGTSTASWLADGSGRVLGRGEAGPSNVKAVGIAAGLGALDAAAADAFRDAGLNPTPVEVACLGLAGFDRPEDRELLEAWNTDRLHARRLLPVNDGDLVVAAGTPEGWGIGLIAGTGSIAVGLGPDGRKARAGGWGHLFGDEGSAYVVALAGLRLAAHRADGRDSKPQDVDVLTRDLCRALEVDEPSGLITAVYGRRLDRTTIARLAPIVVQAAEAGDSASEAVLRQAAEDLAAMVLAVASALGLAGKIPLGIAGGFLLGSVLLRRLTLERLRVIVEGRLIQPRDVPDPVEGAVVLALRAAEAHS